MGTKTKKNVGAIVCRNGVSFRVWAPFANNVSVIGAFNDWNETPLDCENDGYWSVFIRNAKPGQEYKFIIHNGDQALVRNDPRALHFTTSAGNSVITKSGFDWGMDNFQVPPTIHHHTADRHQLNHIDTNINQMI